jgi:hypothetical protein
MDRLIRWAGSQGHWTQSHFGGLPSVHREADPMLQRWQVVAGGLALVLSRLSPTERSAHFAASSRLYQGLRRRLRQGAVIDASSELLSDVMHEIACVADTVTTQCLRACFDASLKQDYPHGAPSAYADTRDHTRVDMRGTSRLQSQPRPSARSTEEPEWCDTAPADVSQARLAARASALRSTIAAARGTQFASAR